MSQSALILQRLQQRASQTDQILAQLKAQISLLKKNAAVVLCEEEENKLKSENIQLRNEVNTVRQKLVVAEIKNGVLQVPLPISKTKPVSPAEVGKPVAAPAVQPAAEKTKPAADEPKQSAEPKKKEKKAADKKETKPPVDSAPIDASRLDMRIGHIVSAKKHPDADGLYVEDVDLGEGKNRTIVSGLVNHVPLKQMQDRLAIFLINLKPAKMRGILSEGMIMCGSSPEVVEIIVPPEGVSKGDKVYVEGFEGQPDGILNPKKKIWEQIQPDLSISADGVATYKGALWRVQGNSGICTVPTMRGTAIK